MQTFFLISIFLLLLLMSDHLSIHVSPRVIMAHGTIILTCHVPRSPNNRSINYGVVDYSDSARGLEGDNAPITFQSTITRIPCGSGPAYCQVTDIYGSRTQVVQSIVIGDCEP